MPAVREVLIQLDVATPDEEAEWRAAVGQQNDDEARATLEAHATGALVLGSLYVEATYGPKDADAVGLTMAGVELRPGAEPLAQVDDEWIADALAECAEQLADEQGIEVSEEELRQVLTVQASIDVLQALDRDA